MTDPHASPAPGARPPGLGPHCVGQRVVVRRVLPGRSGPTGGPAMTDVLGTMTDWTPPTTTVLPAGGEPVVIALADIVSGKPVPPRPSVRLRVTAEQAERRALAGWPPVVAEPLGSWVLRAADGFSARANSVLAVGPPGLPVPAALERVVDFAAAHRISAWAQVVVGSAEAAAVEAAGWVRARPGEADTCFQVASVALASRALRALPVPGAGGPSSPGWLVDTAPVASPGWLAGDARARATPEAARAVLEGPDEVAFVSVAAADAPDTVVAKGRVSQTEDWAGVTDVWVDPGRRRQGLSLLVMARLLGWAAERGATTTYLQTRGDNPAALALYDRLGFVTHHEYRYLAAP
ncbi:GNAT family N-acetyltransferase [Nocardioides mesophilus]|uniref:GNAT family N-acetyltransferase n=1 Tax=Nocardioides mesophilus TaxID=433659 RepID=A0A7G9R7Z0_9ACTN|nr:GNAT family N-acetyltransferase [Nocardioides mesophilus]QNN51715.1 GNAT family N-acetyltransferase [Nocardioides mesophilus]